MAKRPVPLARQDIERRLGDMVEEAEAAERELADVLGSGDDEDDYPDLEDDLNRLLGGVDTDSSRTRRRVRRRTLTSIPAV
jgi:hypothetical protein